jgi:hypothetical protein
MPTWLRSDKALVAVLVPTGLLGALVVLTAPLLGGTWLVPAFVAGAALSLLTASLAAEERPIPDEPAFVLVLGDPVDEPRAAAAPPAGVRRSPNTV